MKELSALKMFTEDRTMYETYGLFLRKMDNLDGSILLINKLIHEYYNR